MGSRAESSEIPPQEPEPIGATLIAEAPDRRNSDAAGSRPEGTGPVEYGIPGNTPKAPDADAEAESPKDEAATAPQQGMQETQQKIWKVVSVHLSVPEWKGTKSAVWH